jgi:hypothetical protein
VHAGLPADEFANRLWLAWLLEGVIQPVFIDVSTIRGDGREKIHEIGQFRCTILLSE